MSDKKYPIGTKIMYCPSKYHCLVEVREDRGRTGTVVGFSLFGYPIIYLPGSKHISYKSTEQTPATWCTNWGHLKILPQKNEQLLFSFME